MIKCSAPNQVSANAMPANDWTGGTVFELSITTNLKSADLDALFQYYGIWFQRRTEKPDEIVVA
jgi:hypothetical protein